MHKKPRNQDTSQTAQDGESEPFITESLSTFICDGFQGRSCAITVLVQVYPKEHQELSLTVNAMMEGH